MRIGLLGAGTVGAAFCDLLQARGPELTDRLHEPLELAAVVVRDAARPRRLALPPSVAVTTDAARVVADPGIEVVVEATTAAVDALFPLARTALARGASFVTANKSLVAARGAELFTLARAGGGDLLFEASVGATVPIVATLQHALAAADIEGVAGVLNGSTNFLLARLDEGASFTEAVAEARALGYLEADPSDDVDGHDAARKIAILASLVSGRAVAEASVACRGLSGVGPGEVRLARALGGALRLLAVAERGADGRDDRAWVAPAVVPWDSPLASVHGAANAVVIRSAGAGEVLVAGQGAGGAPTAQALGGDVVMAALRRRAGARGPLGGWREAVAGAVPGMGRVPYALRVEAGALGSALAGRIAALTGVEATLALGDGALGVTTTRLAADDVEALRQRILHLPAAEAVGPALVRWAGLGPAAAEGRGWWRVPITAPAATSAPTLHAGRERS